MHPLAPPCAEFNTMMSWLSWKPPARICMSEQGIFTHNEIDQ